MFRVALTNASNSNVPVRMGDSDQTWACKLGLAFLCRNRRSQPEASDFFYRPFVGGLTATTRDRHPSKCDLDYVAMAAGGEWIEGRNTTLALCVCCSSGPRAFERQRRGSFSGNHPVGIGAAASVVCRHAGLKQFYQWGDSENPGAFVGRLFAWQTTNGLWQV